MGDTTTIPLSRETRDLLKRFGRKGETYDELIRRLLAIAEQIEFAERQKRILAEEVFVPLDQVRCSPVPDRSVAT
ncbi:MAG: DUF7557 family protein [Candidatus Thorarchaeota archaeon]